MKNTTDQDLSCVGLDVGQYWICRGQLIRVVAIDYIADTCTLYNQEKGFSYSCALPLFRQEFTPFLGTEEQRLRQNPRLPAKPQTAPCNWLKPECGADKLPTAKLPHSRFDTSKDKYAPVIALLRAKVATQRAWPVCVISKQPLEIQARHEYYDALAEGALICQARFYCPSCSGEDKL